MTVLCAEPTSSVWASAAIPSRRLGLPLCPDFRHYGRRVRWRLLIQGSRLAEHHQCGRTYKVQSVGKPLRPDPAHPKAHIIPTEDLVHRRKTLDLRISAMVVGLVFIGYAGGCSGETQETSVRASSQASSDESASAENATSGPRPPLRGQPSVANHTDLKLSLAKFAEMFASDYGSNCTPSKIIEHSGWVGYEDFVPEKGQEIFISCGEHQ